MSGDDGTTAGHHGGQVSPPAFSPDAGVAGTHTTTLADLLSAGLDPTAAFGSAFALNRVVGQEHINQYLNTVAGNPTPPAAPQPPSAPPQTAPKMPEPRVWATGQDGTTTLTGGDLGVKSAAADAAADDGGRAAVKAAQFKLKEAIVDRGVKRAAAEAGVLAARRGAMLGAKVGAQTALRLGAMSLPGLGTAITVAFWLCDTGERQAVNNLVSSLFGPGAAPDLNAPPEPPRTRFLPLTHDGNRDDTIVQMDAGMVRTNPKPAGQPGTLCWSRYPRVIRRAARA